MRKAFIFVIATGFFSIQSVGQIISVGIKGGVSIPNLRPSGENNPLNTGYQSSLGPNGALFGEYAFSNLLSVELSLEFSSQGGQKNGKQALPVDPSSFPPGQAPQYVWANFNAEAKLNYLMIPLLVKGNFALGSQSRFRLYADVGPFVGFLLSAKTVTKGTSNVYLDEGETQPILPYPVSFDTTADIKDQLHPTNFGIEANIGLSYSFNQNTLFLEGGGNYGFVDIQKNKADGQNKAGAATIRIGYAYTLRSRNPNSKSVKDPKVF
ncbi:MAG TPA: porin family protein [Puia sp.]|nr:porin family protein [Puia sp.]